MLRSLALAAAAVLVSGERIEVDWKIVQKDETMQSIKAKPGDTLVFAWRGWHNVYLMDSCDGKGIHRWDQFTCPNPWNGETFGTNLGQTSVVEYVIPADAPEYLCFVCEVNGHCNAGQHSTVQVMRDAPKEDKNQPTVHKVDWKIVQKDEQMQSLTVMPGDQIVFEWRGWHNVYLMNSCDGAGDQKWDSFTCPSNFGEDLGETSPVTYNVPKNAKAGDYLCFACEVPGHCMAGQHTTVLIGGKADDGKTDDKPAKKVKTHKVDWRIVRSDEDMQSLSVKPGEKILFEWSGFHNVYLLDDCDAKGAQKWDDFTCPADMGTDLGDRSPVEYTVPADARTLCFVCEVGSHCNAGQHTTVIVRRPKNDKKKDGEDLDADMQQLWDLCSAQTETQNCKACMGKIKGGKCTFKEKKLRKMKCKKATFDLDFCEALGCTVKGKVGRQKCGGKSKLL